jgi:hypothetical protein
MKVEMKSIFCDSDQLKFHLALALAPALALALALSKPSLSEACAQCYKTFYGRNLQIFEAS